MTLAALVVPGLYNRHISQGLQSGDVVAPTYDVVPALLSNGPTTIQVAATLSDDSDLVYLYAVALADAAAAPTSAQVFAGTDSLDAPALNGNGMSTSGSQVVASISGLTQATAYDVYVVGADQFDNLVASPTKLDITTATPSTISQQPTIGPTFSRGLTL